MKLQTRLAISTIILITILSSCSRPDCKNSNPVFNQKQPGSTEYKAELVKQLQTIDRSKLTYWFKDYVEAGGRELLQFDVQGDGLCAVMEIEVEDWTRLADLRKKKGASYRGAEFKDLKFDILQDSSSIRILFKNYSDIID